MRKANYHKPILITGIQRSGTTIIARAFQKSNTFFGNTSEMMENDRLRILLNDLYRSMGADFRGHYTLPDINNLKTLDKNQIFYHLHKDGYYGQKRWCFKSNRILQTYPIWNTLFPNADLVIVRRNKQDILNSCLNTGYMKVFKNSEIQKKINVQTEAEGWLWWIETQEKIIDQMVSTANKKVWQITPELIAQGDYTKLKECIEGVGLEWDETKVVNEIAPLFWSNKQSRNNGK